MLKLVEEWWSEYREDLPPDTAPMPIVFDTGKPLGDPWAPPPD
jgi:hypothetical protein